MAEYNEMQQVKRRFFAMRNGVIADVMRKSGNGTQIVFGLNLPQIKEIAADFGHNPSLASALWSDARCRESGMLAPYLWDASDFTSVDTLVAAVDAAPSFEAIDILCLALLRSHPLVADLFDTLVERSSGDFQLYTSMRLALGRCDFEAMERLAQKANEKIANDASHPSLRQISRQLLAELADPI